MSAQQLKRLEELIKRIDKNKENMENLRDTITGKGYRSAGSSHNDTSHTGIGHSGGAKSFSQAVSGGQAQYSTGYPLPPRLGGIMPALIRQLEARGKNDEVIGGALDKIKGGKRMTQKDRKELELEMADILAHKKLREGGKQTGGLWPLLFTSLAPMALGVASKLMGKGLSGGSLTGGLLSGGQITGAGLSGGAKVKLEENSNYDARGMPLPDDKVVARIPERPSFASGGASKTFAQAVTGGAKSFSQTVTGGAKLKTGGRPRRGGVAFNLTKGDSYHLPVSEGTMASWNPHGVSANKMTGSNVLPPQNSKGRNLHNANGGGLSGGTLTGGKKKSSWIDHVKKVAAEEGISYKEALKVAKASYQK